jgi:hypothetical protein
MYDFVYCGICKNPKYQQKIIIHARDIYRLCHVATNMFGSTLRPLHFFIVVTTCRGL